MLGFPKILSAKKPTLLMIALDATAPHIPVRKRTKKLHGYQAMEGSAEDMAGLEVEAHARSKLQSCQH